MSAPLFRLGLTAALGGFLFGYDTSSMSAALLQVKRPRNDITPCPGLIDRPLTISEQQMITSFVVLGAFFSASAAGSLNAVLGRRKVILIGSVLSLAGAVSNGVATTYWFMLVGRFVRGLGVGLNSHTVPLYLAECAPATQRGWFCFFNDMMIVVGQMVAAAVSAVFFYAEVRDGWRWILGLAAIPAVLMFIGVLMQDESPRWLLSKGRGEEAMGVLQVLRGSSAEAEEDFERMSSTVRDETKDEANASGFWTKVWLEPHVRRALVLGCGLQALQQWSGINTIMYYGATVLQRAGPVYDSRADNCFNAANKDDVVTTVLFAGAQLLGVFASWWLVDHVGRRPLILASLAGVSTFLFITGVAFSLNDVSQELVVAAVALYLISFGVGMSPVPWTVNAEIYPLHVRGQCLSLATSTNWAMNFIVARTFLTLATSLSSFAEDRGQHPNGVFFLYASISVIGLVLLYLHMPETKGLALEEIGRLFTKPDDFEPM
jgi:SP family myo-inositol transporter-like MFS transporter 13